PPSAAIDPRSVSVRLVQGAARSADGVQPVSLDTIRYWLRAGERTHAIDAMRYSMDSYTGKNDLNAARYILGRLLTDDLDPAGLEYLEALPVPFESFDDRRLLWLSRAQRLNGKTGEAIDTLAKLFS